MPCLLYDLTSYLLCTQCRPFRRINGIRTTWAFLCISHVCSCFACKGFTSQYLFLRSCVFKIVPVILHKCLQRFAVFPDWATETHCFFAIAIIDHHIIYDFSRDHPNLQPKVTQDIWRILIESTQYLLWLDLWLDRTCGSKEPATCG